VDEPEIQPPRLPRVCRFHQRGLGALRVGDFALVVINAAHGLGVGTDAVWDYATHHGLPKIIAVNALDKANVSFDAIVESAREHFGRKVFPVAIPLNAGPGFSHVLDVMRNEIVTYTPGGNGHYAEKPAGALAERVQQLHRELIEYVAESDDTLMGKFFEGDSGEEEFRAGLHQADPGPGLRAALRGVRRRPTWAWPA
jgi:elongation factor G